MRYPQLSPSAVHSQPSRGGAGKTPPSREAGDLLSRKPTEAVTSLPAYYFLSKVSVTGLRAEAGLVGLWASVGCCGLGPLLGSPQGRGQAPSPANSLE